MGNTLMSKEYFNNLENHLCIGMEESLLKLPFFIECNERMEKLYDQMIFKYFEIYHSVNFIPDKTKVTLVESKKEREV